MTALKPTENRLVRAVPSERYPLNRKCAHPECSEDAVDPHHAFPRSAIGGDSWFVELRFELDGEKERIAAVLGRPSPSWSTIPLHGKEFLSVVIPHVTGLCRAHHEQVELHHAWIKLEDGVWNWYDRDEDAQKIEDDGHLGSWWVLVGPLNPQPGSVEGKAKRKKFMGEARRKRKTISIKVPQDEQEDGAGILDDLMAQARIALGDEEDKPAYYVLVAALYALITTISREEQEA